MVQNQQRDRYCDTLRWVSKPSRDCQNLVTEDTRMGTVEYGVSRVRDKGKEFSLADAFRADYSG